MGAGIIATKLTKTYPGDKEPALDSLDLHVATGEIYGYLGANGAGKSTTIRLLLNFIQPTSGSARIGDLDIVKDSVAIKRTLGHLAGDVALHPKVSGKELLDYLAQLQGGVDTRYRRTLETRFESELHKPIGSLSKGNRQKIGIIQAFMHTPSVLILDEPTSGLDPLMQEAFYETVREAKTRGAAVLMSSHNLAEATTLCDRIGIIRRGKLIREQVVTEALSLAKPSFTITLANKTAADALAADKRLGAARRLDAVKVQLTSDNTIAETLSLLSNYPITALETNRLDLEDEFLQFYTDKEPNA